MFCRCKTLFVVISIGSLATLSLFLYRLTPQSQTFTRRYDASANRMYVIQQDYNISDSDQWIVVTTVSEPTPDVKFLAEIPGWKVVVVGDTKTPRNWRHPGCVFLSIEDQHSLSFETVPYLPQRSYARKSVGYLFAIAHGAKVIYETDDDNRPLDLLQNFVLEPTMWGLLYDGERLFNPYRHFGQPTLWPRGYPLSAIGENITTNYLLNQWKTPSIQQGVVNGDPDMDAIFRLTRKETLSVLNVTFDRRAPPAIVSTGVFSPFNSQNTLFLYDALWALLIPTTTSFRVCDIWRGYWAQRLLWEMGGNLGFFPPNAFQKRNSHTYLFDAVDEKDLYFETERLVDYLKRWRCDATKPFFDCVVQLSADMAVNEFWKERDAELTKAWVKDLKSLGYKEPVRVQLGSLKNGARVIEANVVQPQMTKMTFWAAEQMPPEIYPYHLSNKHLVSHASKIMSICKTYKTKLPRTDITATVNTYPNILLILVFNFPHYENVFFLEIMYRMHFPHIVYCGSRRDLFDKHAKALGKPVTFLEIEVDRGMVAQSCMTQAMKMHYKVDGYLHMGDDVLLNVWNLHKAPWDKVWVINDTIFRQSGDDIKWRWFNKNKVGLKEYQAAIEATKSLDKDRWDRFFKMLARNTGYSDALYKATADILYAPKRHEDDIIYFVDHFSRFNLYVGLAIPTVFAGIDKFENFYIFPGKYLWYDGKRAHFDQQFDEDEIFLHPVKISKALNTEIGRKFYCEKYLPLTMPR